VTVTAIITEMDPLFKGDVWADVSGPDPATRYLELGDPWQTDFTAGLEGTYTATDTLAGLFSLAFPDTTDYGTTYGLGGAITATRSQSYDFDTGDTFSATVSISATDRATNVITQPVTVIRDSTPPTVTFDLPGTAPLRFPVAWSGEDVCGVRHYDVAYKQGTGGTWTTWLILRAGLRTSCHHPDRGGVSGPVQPDLLFPGAGHR